MQDRRAAQVRRADSTDCTRRDARPCEPEPLCLFAVCDQMRAWALCMYAALASCATDSAASLPSVSKKELLSQEALAPPRPTKKRLAGGWTRTTADSEPQQHFMPPPNYHLPERMGCAEFVRRFVHHNISIHDPASDEYKPFALPPPSIRPGVDSRDVFDWLDADGSADLTVPELKQMRDHPDIRMPEASMAGIRLPYFAATFADRMRDDVDTTEVFETLDADKNGVLTRKETRAAKQFFKGELR